MANVKIRLNKFQRTNYQIYGPDLIWKNFQNNLFEWRNLNDSRQK